MAPADEKLLSELWSVGMKVPALVRKVAGRVPLRAVQAWARERRLRDAAEPASSSAAQPRKLPAWMAQAELASLGLTQQQLDALNELFWTRNRGAIGVRQLWEQLRDHPQQKAALAASDGREGWISWRELMIVSIVRPLLSGCCALRLQPAEPQPYNRATYEGAPSRG